MRQNFNFVVFFVLLEYISSLFFSQLLHRRIMSVPPGLLDTIIILAAAYKTEFIIGSSCNPW